MEERCCQGLRELDLVVHLPVAEASDHHLEAWPNGGNGSINPGSQIPCLTWSYSATKINGYVEKSLHMHAAIKYAPRNERFHSACPKPQVANPDRGRKTSPENTKFWGEAWTFGANRAEQVCLCTHHFLNTAPLSTPTSAFFEGFGNIVHAGTVLQLLVFVFHGSTCVSISQWGPLF